MLFFLSMQAKMEATKGRLKEAMNFARRRIHINIVETGASGQTRHRTHVSQQRI